MRLTFLATRFAYQRKPHLLLCSFFSLSATTTRRLPISAPANKGPQTTTSASSPPPQPPTQMPPKPVLPTHTFPTAAAFDAFLSQHHTTLPGLYLQLAKKDTGIPTITADESIQVALCHGWIDGVTGSYGPDTRYYTKRFTPRRPRSLWSQRNVATVARLAAAGRMRPAGLAQVAAAKADGRWDRAYHGPATMQVPDDFAAALQAVPAAAAFFARLKSTERYSVLWRVETASPTARAGRIEALVGLLAEGTVVGARAKAAAKASKEGDGKRGRVETVGGKRGSARRKLNDGTPVQDSASRAREPLRAGLRPRR